MGRFIESIIAYESKMQEEAEKLANADKDRQKRDFARGTAFQRFVMNGVKELLEEAEKDLRQSGRDVVISLFPMGRHEASLTFNVKKDRRVGVNPSDDSTFVIVLYPHGPAVCQSFYDMRHSSKAHANIPQGIVNIGVEEFDIGRATDALRRFVRNALHRHEP